MGLDLKGLLDDFGKVGKEDATIELPDMVANASFLMNLVRMSPRDLAQDPRWIELSAFGSSSFGSNSSAATLTGATHNLNILRNHAKRLADKEIKRMTLAFKDFRHLKMHAPTTEDEDDFL